MPPLTLSKDERLHGKNDIGNLLNKGKSGEIGLIRYRFLNHSGCDRNRMMVSVSKRLFKRAVKRNLLKRRIRESYRQQKDSLPEQGGTDILFIYNTKEILSFAEIYDAVGKILKKINGNGGQK